MMAPGVIHEAHALNRVRKAAAIAGELRARGWTAGKLREVIRIRDTRLAAQKTGQHVSDQTWEWAVVVMEALESVKVTV